MLRLLAHGLCFLTLLIPFMSSAFHNVRDYGAVGDGVALDSPALNAAIAAAADAGGGTVYLPAGRYLCLSIRLKSHLTIQFAPGAVIVAADPKAGHGTYDPAEPSEWTAYQDFGHSHFQNSLIWGEDLTDVAIVGPGLIDGTTGIVKFGPGARSDPGIDPTASMAGLANKAIALKNCRNVLLRDFSILNGGHFALLATGVDNFTLDHLKVDTNRDGFDIDACRNVRITNCSVNTPNDDAIVLKSSYALGHARATENVTISDCLVSGYDIGTMLDGTYRRTVTHSPDQDGPTGRIKLGTESNGGFRHITITNCIFDRSRGLALETVDGGAMEDIVVSNLTMRELSNAPIFIRLGNRARGPEGTPVATVKRIRISQISVSDGDGRFPIIIAGLPGHPIEDVTIEGIHVESAGGVTMENVAEQTPAMVNLFFQRGQPASTTGPREPFDVPEREAGYPEPSNFGLLPASAVYARHVRNLTVRDLTHRVAQRDTRPAVVLDDVHGVLFDALKAPREDAPLFHLRDVTDFEAYRCPDSPDTRIAQVTREEW